MSNRGIPQFPQNKPEDIGEFNIVRRVSGLPQLTLRTKSCLKCHKKFTTFSNYICPDCTELNLSHSAGLPTTSQWYTG